MQSTHRAVNARREPSLPGLDDHRGADAGALGHQRQEALPLRGQIHGDETRGNVPSCSGARARVSRPS